METPSPPTDTSSSRDSGEDEVSLLDILVVLARNRTPVVRTITLFLVVGLVMALFSKSEFTSQASVVREVAQGETPGSSAITALRGFGLNLGSAESGLTAAVYPAIVESREVRLAVVRDTYLFPGGTSSFVNWRTSNTGVIRQILSGLYDYTIGLPATIRAAMTPERSAFPSDSSAVQLNTTADEEESMKALSDIVRTSEDIDSGIMRISVTTVDPNLSAQLAQSVVRHLVERVRQVYALKSGQNLAFIRERFGEARSELATADSALALFEDRNTGVTSALLDTERQRLQREVTFKSQLFSDLQTQLTSTEIEYQRAEPVITVVEEPVPAYEPSGPHRFLIIFLSLVLGLIIGVALAIFRAMIHAGNTNPNSRQKMDEIRNAFYLFRRTSRNPDRIRHGSTSSPGT